MAQPGTEGAGQEGEQPPPPASDVVRPGSGRGAAGSAGVVRPVTSTGSSGSAAVPPPPVVAPTPSVVPPGTGVVRPGTGVVRPGSASIEGAAKAFAAVPDAPEKPLAPIHVVLPDIPVKPVKQGFLDRLVAGKTEAEKAEEEARREEETRRKAEQAQRAQDEKARKEADQARREQAEADEKVRAKVEEQARREQDKQRRAEAKVAERQRRAEEKAERQAAREAADADEDYEDEDSDEDYEEEFEQPRGFAGPAAPPRPAPPPIVAPPKGPPPAPPAPPRPGPIGPGPQPGGPGPQPGGPGPLPGGPGGPGARPGPWPGPAPARQMPGRGARGPRGGYAGERPGYRERDRYQPERIPSSRPWWHWAVAVGAVIALGGGAGAVVTSLSGAQPADYHPGVDTGPPAPVLQGIGDAAPVPSTAGLDAALGGLFGTSDLGSTAVGSVMDAGTGQLLWQHNGTAAVSPASTAKLITAAAVLSTRGPDYRIATKAVAGPNPGDVVLIGGGDPTLAAGANTYYRGAARLDLLAQQVKQALGNTAPARVLIDTSLFSGPTAGPSGTGDVGSAICNITALMINGGRVDPSNRSESLTCSAQPDVAAGQAFAQALGVSAQVVTGTAAPGAKALGEVDSPPISSIVEQMLVDSDNGVAEMMAHQVALAKGLPASFAGGAQATAAVLADLGVPTGAELGLEDGSGLSYGDKVTANQLTALLTKATSPDHPELRALLSGLPVAGYSGTLDLKNRAMGAGKGVVRAKTGTLTGVNALAGYVVDADGRLLIFAAVGNGTGNQTAAENALDHIAEGVSACGCR